MATDFLVGTRIGSGVVELITSVMLLVPRSTVFGALLSLGIICGALMAHITMLGIKLTAVGDNGELFELAVTVFLLSSILLYFHRREIPVIGSRPFPMSFKIAR